MALLPVMAAAAPRTVLNLNVPSVRFDELRGVRRGRIGTAGLIKAAELMDGVDGAAARRGEIRPASRLGRPGPR